MKRVFAIGTVLLGLALCLFACQSTGSRALRDGSYRGTARGYAGDIVLDVSFSGGRFADIKVISEDETREYGGRAIAELPARIIAEQSLDCDVVSGATITSRAIFRSVAAAITQAGGSPAAFGYTSIEDISASGLITFTGLPDGREAVYSGAQLMDMPSVTVDAQSVNASGTVSDVRATGVLLETVLRTLGVSQRDFESIIVTATDGYSIEYPKDVLYNRDIILAWEVNGDPQSPRTVVPGERAMYWVKFLSTFELKGEVKIENVYTIDILETMVAQIPGEDYKYYDSVDKAVPISAIFEKYIGSKADFVTLRSIDSWGKNDRYDTVAAQFIKYTGEFAPMFIGPALPEGMRLKNTLSMQIGGEFIARVEMAMLMENISAGDGLPVTALFAISHMIDAPAYTFEGVDGYRVSIDRADISKGVLTVTDGVVAARFDGLARNTSVRGLLYIKANTG
ncbi:MAG: FMN-binding protein [Treponema sp.]|jgi:uncharacterized protein with FMN-binding domain|nr:FMN-binding protein [Treponema sp.]